LRWRSDAVNAEPLNDHGEEAGGTAYVRRSRELSLLDQIGDFAISGPDEMRAKLREQLLRRCNALQPEATDVRAITDRALNRIDPSNWIKQMVRLPDGREVLAHQYKSPPEEEERLRKEGAVAAANLQELNLRVSLEKVS
jgi:hypothetical protein